MTRFMQGQPPGGHRFAAPGTKKDGLVASITPLVRVPWQHEFRMTSGHASALAVRSHPGGNVGGEASAAFRTTARRI